MSVGVGAELLDPVRFNRTPSVTDGLAGDEAASRLELFGNLGPGHLHPIPKISKTKMLIACHEGEQLVADVQQLIQAEEAKAPPDSASSGAGATEPEATEPVPTDYELSLSPEYPLY